MFVCASGFFVDEFSTAVIGAAKIFAGEEVVEEDKEVAEGVEAR